MELDEDPVTVIRMDMPVKQFLKNSIGVLVLATAIGGEGSSRNSGPSCPPGGSRQSGCRNGDFDLLIVGTHRGVGTAQVDDTEVSITGSITTSSGEQLRLEARDLQAVGPYFAGLGTLGNTRLYVSGRLDLVKASRLVATFTTEAGEFGRIVGRLPNDPGNQTWRTSDSEGGNDD